MVACAPKTATVPDHLTVCAGAFVPPRVFENHAGGTKWDDFGFILAPSWDILVGDHFEAIGHDFVSSGHHFETLGHYMFPRLGLNAILARFSHQSFIPEGNI